MVLAVLLLATGCASVQRAPGQGQSLSHTPRAATPPTWMGPSSSGQPYSPVAVPHAISGADEPARMSRRRIHREDVTGAGPGTAATAVGGPVTAGPAHADSWDVLLTNAGLADGDERPLPGGALTPTQAARLLKRLLGKPVTLGQFPSRLAAGYLLRKALEGGELSRAELLRQVERFTHLAVLRPDGCLAWVRSGKTQQRVASVEWRDGGFRAHGFELGRFYDGRTGVYRLLDGDLREADGRPLAEVYDDADYLGRSLDGAESAVVKLALSLGHFFTYPLDSLAALKNLPTGVAELIESSPEYFERFRYMTRGEQIEAVAELATNLLLTTGTAAATTRTVTGVLAGAEATVPVLSLSAQGALTLERVAVPVGRAASVLGGGSGAAIILHRANANTGQSAPSGGKGPGEWGPADEKGASERARAYQEQISGRSYDEAYWVGGIGRKSGGTKFDGFEEDVLLEAKGPGYAEFFEKNLSPKSWYVASGKAEELVDQARRQTERVAGRGILIEWHVAEKHAADAIRKLLAARGFPEISVIHSPARALVP